MASQNKSTQKWEFDTFLSFGGQDTRDNFIKPLHKRLQQTGITVFKDDEKVGKGKLILTELFKAIENSRSAIIVFSENYASSTWCLEELTKINECIETKGLKVFMVFYDVEPSDVRMQRNSFGRALAKLEADLHVTDLDKLAKWKEALRKAPNFAGPDARKTAKGDEEKCIELIVKEIYRCVEGGVSTIVKYQLGIESRVNKVETLLKVGLDDVHFVGICGRAGEGKTTVARAIFDKISCQFEGSCFLANVKGISNKHETEGLKYLQENLLLQILGRENAVPHLTSVDEGVKMIRTMLRSKRVLIVLDDVDDDKQLECLVGKRDWFGDGTRIITTTRNADLLHNHNELYSVPELARHEALELFSWYAFQRGTPNKEFEKLSCSVVNYASGLPLVLEILGSFLYGRSTEEWTSAIERLEDTGGDRNIVKQLNLSLDGLDNEDKNIFLYIACSYKGKKKDDVITILNKFGFKSEIGINFLAKKLLLYISEGRIEMHDLIEQMGQQVAHDVHQDKLRNLWHDNYINAVFLANQISRTTFPMASQNESAKKWKYDAFLSFRGEDTRRTFTSHLYNCLEQTGICIFKDDVVLERGDCIATTLFKNIQESRIAIIIFSKNYASSRWCLDELTKIMECADNNGTTVFPVFLDIEPSDVRKQRNSFANAFAKHKTMSDLEKVGKWKEVLRNVANIAGWDVAKASNGDWGECIKLIVNQVTQNVNTTQESKRRVIVES